MSIQIQIGADIGNVDQAINQVNKSLNNIKAPAANASAALFSVSQVTRDLPFGFIAIQNNLPGVIDSFGALTKASGGIGGALKNLGAALAGPAGISFAFGAVVAGATALIQKYGSLGNAVKELFGINTQLSESEKAYNDQIQKTSASLTTEQAKVDSLTRTLLDNKKPQDERIAAYEELKKVAPDVVAGIRDENALTEASNALIAQQAQQRRDLIRLKIQEAGISAALTKNAELLATKTKELADAQNEEKTTLAALNKTQQNKIITGFGDVSQQQAAFSAYQSSAKSVKDLQAEIANLTRDQDKYLSQLDPIVNGIAKSNKATNDRVNALKGQIKAEKDAANESEKNSKAAASRNKKLTAQEQRDLEAAEKARLQGFERIAKFRAKQLEEQAAKNRAIAVKEAETTAQAELDAFQKTIDAQLAAEPIVITPIQTDKIIKEANLSQAVATLDSVFFNPVQGLFDNFIQTGKFAFKDFAKSILAAISQIVSRIIATGIISLLANLLFPGAPGAISGVGNILKSAFGSATGFQLGGGQVAAPSFGNVAAGSMGLTGAVNLTLRGSDLVASMNRTNTTITRVG